MKISPEILKNSSPDWNWSFKEGYFVGVRLGTMDDKLEVVRIFPVATLVDANNLVTDWVVDLGHGRVGYSQWLSEQASKPTPNKTPDRMLVFIRHVESMDGAILQATGAFKEEIDEFVGDGQNTCDMNLPSDGLERTGLHVFEGELAPPEDTFGYPVWRGRWRPLCADELARINTEQILYP